MLGDEVFGTEEGERAGEICSTKMRITVEVKLFGLERNSNLDHEMQECVIGGMFY